MSVQEPVPDRSVVVVGAGIVGACAALALLDAGWSVTLVDPGDPGGPQAASHGNGGWISPASVVPMSTPGLWRRLPGLLLDRDGPLTMRMGSLPGLAPWLWRFLRAGSDLTSVQRTAGLLATLLGDAPDRHLRLAAEAGVPHLVQRRGLLYAYPDRQAFAADALGWDLRRRQGIAWTELDRPADPEAIDPIARLVPGLAARYRFGALVDRGAHCLDPGAYVAALVALAQRRGARHVRGRVADWRWRDPTQPSRSRQLDAVMVDDAGTLRPLPARKAVLCAGIGSAGLAARAGAPVPLASERGYHLVLPWRPSGSEGQDASCAGTLAPQASDAWPLPVMPSDGRMAVTPTLQGLRIAGQVELGAIEAPPDPRRLDVLWRHARRLVAPAARATLDIGPEAAADGPCDAAPSLPGPGEPPPPAAWPDTRPDALPVWMGHRPSTPDGLPAVGPANGCPDVVLAFGHGHVGLAAGPLTAELVAAVLSGRGVPDGRLVAALAPERFNPIAADGSPRTGPALTERDTP